MTRLVDSHAQLWRLLSDQIDDRELEELLQQPRRILEKYKVQGTLLIWNTARTSYIWHQ